ncbi:helix-turn-helix domain-containing protein [Actinomadura oligospora]|uniref:helix-turn-helix domain-containing protein n=1 Tax=Actinomadura oligospora TaxID=111804 RepID=UPI00047DB315|nr:helix-turn-helix transcriptional regulator [Actinomadura oligospora]
MPDKQRIQPVIDPHKSAWALYAYKLRKMREQAGLSQPEIGRACLVSGKLVSAIETLRRLPGEDFSKRLDVRFDLDFFEDQYHQINRELKLPCGFDEYEKQETQAGIIHSYDPLAIPGILQTEDYTRAIMRRIQRPEQLDQMVAARMRRQEILDRDPYPLIVCLVKEAALREVIGGRDVLRGQLAKLLEVAELPHVSIEVIPNGSGIVLASGFAMLQFAEGAPVGWTEAAFGHGHLVQDSATLHEMRVAFDLSRREALSVFESVRLIRAILEAM